MFLIIFFVEKIISNENTFHDEVRDMWALLIILLLLWVLGFGFEIAGNLIHLLLVVALVVLIFKLVTGRRV